MVHHRDCHHHGRLWSFFGAGLAVLGQSIHPCLINHSQIFICARRRDSLDHIHGHLHLNIHHCAMLLARHAVLNWLPNTGMLWSMWDDSVTFWAHHGFHQQAQVEENKLS